MAKCGTRIEQVILIFDTEITAETQLAYSQFSFTCPFVQSLDILHPDVELIAPRVNPAIGECGKHEGVIGAWGKTERDR